MNIFFLIIYFAFQIIRNLFNYQALLIALFKTNVVNVVPHIGNIDLTIISR